MLDQPSVYVDIETTGSSARHDRITEIAVIETRDGQVIDEWNTLINPDCMIPARIQALTGITNDMVADAPTFSQIADNLLEALQGRLFVAHNARFDYEFLRAAFEREGRSFMAQVLCTVKLSRGLFPDERRHNLDSIIGRYNIACESRHRALGDARAMLAFVDHVRATCTTAEISEVVRPMMKRPSLPAGLTEADIESIPDTAGVYLFYDQQDVLLYVGKSIQMRTRVLSHFNSSTRSRSDARIVQQIARIDFIKTAGELGALLREAQLVKQLQPVHNRRLRRQRGLSAIQWDPHAVGGPPPVIVDATTFDPAATDCLFGVFRTRSQARDKLRELADEFTLCLRRSGLEAGKGGPCFAFQLKKCHGVCVGAEQEAVHHLRLFEALSTLKLKAWPWNGLVGIRESCQETGREEVHLVDHWCYLGTAHAEEDIVSLVDCNTEPLFDLDFYRILSRHLLRHPNMTVQEIRRDGEVTSNAEPAS